jgi:hypothetical protein
MLMLVTLFLVSLIISATVIWLCRLIFNWHNFKETVADDPDKTTRDKIEAFRVFMSLFASAREPAEAKSLRSPDDNIRAPWGW